MKWTIIASTIVICGCTTPLFVNECIYPLGKDYKPDPNEIVYGWSKAEFAAMPKYCGTSKQSTIVDRNGRVIGYIR